MVVILPVATLAATVISLSRGGAGATSPATSMSRPSAASHVPSMAAYAHAVPSSSPVHHASSSASATAPRSTDPAVGQCSARMNGKLPAFVPSGFKWSGKSRQYFVRAEELMWDYIPSSVYTSLRSSVYRNWIADPPLLFLYRVGQHARSVQIWPHVMCVLMLTFDLNTNSSLPSTFLHPLPTPLPPP